MSTPGRSTEDIVALALMVILNWLLAHLLTNWVLPPEVQSAFQTLITVAIAAWLNAHHETMPAAPVSLPPLPAPAPAKAVDIGEVRPKP